MSIQNMLKARGKTATIRVVDVYTSENKAIQNPTFIDSVANPVTQKAYITSSRRRPGSSDSTEKDSGIRRNDDLEVKFDWALEIGYLPGVTDNIGHTAQELLALAGAVNDNACYTSRLYLIEGNVTRADVEALSKDLANTLIQRIQIKDAAQFKRDGGMDVVIPKVLLDNKGAVADDVDLNIDDKELTKIGQDGIQNADGSRRGPLGMSLLYMQAVRDYFKKEGRPAKDIEIETLAQTWSEHCKHTIFASPIDDIKDGIYRHYIKRATNEIRKKRQQEASSRRKPGSSASTEKDPGLHRDDGLWRDEDRLGDICVSVFSDNAGGIIFDDNYLITDKVETHNSPSALDPFGGAITGIVGVNRDCVGFGKGAKPVINRYGFCFAPVPVNQGQLLFEGRSIDRQKVTVPGFYRDKALKTPILSPETIMNGVVAGVNHGGNCSGIPTPQGFVYFDERFIGKPLVFVGTIGLIPRTINGTPGHEKRANPGDKIMMVGGRVGRDGIHGATFSSVALDEGSPATAVQIGDPITQKKFSDAIVKELRDKGWYSAITDNGAGGLSSSVGEMAGQSGGFHVELEKVPLKYPGMAPWEIWISESQERMTLAVPPTNTQKIIDFLRRRGVEATVIGTYTDSGRSHITWHGETIMDLSMDFLHDGVPETPLKTTFTPGGTAEPNLPEPLYRHPDRTPAKAGGVEGSPPRKGDPSAQAPQDDAIYHDDLLLQMLSRLNICSKEFISVQYDHEVQAGAVLKPLQGPGRVYAEATITKPVLSSPKGVVLSQGLFPRYSDIDTYHMAAASLDMAVRNAVAAGVDYDHLALLDNFCWCSSDEPERLGQLKRAAEAIYNLAVLYETPFISGKDSMFNDFKGFDKNGHPVKISAPPTTLISSIGVIPDVAQSISLAPKAVGDLVYLLGTTKDELGGSEYYDQLGHLGSNVPQVDGGRNNVLYKRYSRAARDRLIASALAVGYGGLGVALAKKAIAGQMGLDIDITSICHPERAAEGSHANQGDSSSQAPRNDSSKLTLSKALYSESAGRILITVAPQNQKAFEKVFKGFDHVHLLGHVAYGNKLNVKNILHVDVQILDEAYKAPLRSY